MSDRMDEMNIINKKQTTRQDMTLTHLSKYDQYIMVTMVSQI
jgi:hypothetical protein